MSQNDRAQYLRALHQKGNPLILCNVYDGETARIVLSHNKISQSGRQAKALATSSYAVAAVRGKSDEALEPEMLASAAQDIISVIDEVSESESHGKTNDPIPLTIDMRDGWGERLEDTVSCLINAGVVGCNIEDEDGQTGRLMTTAEAAERVRRVMHQAEKMGVCNFVVNARTDVLGHGGTIEEAIERGKAYVQAGAFCVFIWGGNTGRGVSRGEMKRLVEAFDGFVNARLKTGEGYLRVEELVEMGVRRISLGKELQDIAMEAYRGAVEKILV